MKVLRLEPQASTTTIVAWALENIEDVAVIPSRCRSCCFYGCCGNTDVHLVTLTDSDATLLMLTFPGDLVVCADKYIP